MNRSHINVTVPSFSDTMREQQAALLSAERDFWKREAEGLRAELANIPVALIEWGECYIRDEDGKQWHLALDPEKHPKPES